MLFGFAAMNGFCGGLGAAIGGAATAAAGSAENPSKASTRMVLRGAPAIGPVARTISPAAALDEVAYLDDVAVCEHLDQITIEPPESVAGCEDCLAIGAQWVHLRICMSCGHVGCCDSSPNRHASKHAAASGHPIVRSMQPGESWLWCYEDEVAFEIG